MRNGMPVALVYGIGWPITAKLVEVLNESEIEVVGVGEWDRKLNTMEKVAIRESLPEEMAEIDYVFDFKNEVEWKGKLNPNAKLTKVRINEEVKETGAGGEDMDWREVCGHGVVGRGVINQGKTKGLEFLVSAVELAVNNKNLILPASKEKVRLVGERSMVEAVMRATFLSNTQGNEYHVWGNKVGMEEIADWLINEAKMTKNKVMVTECIFEEPEDEVVKRYWNSLRWQPGEDVKEGLGEMLKEMFVRKDEEGRKPKRVVETKATPREVAVVADKESVGPKKMFEVMVETPEVAIKPMTVERERMEVEEVKEEKEEKEETPMVEIKPLIPVRNSNMRKLQTREEKLETSNEKLETSNKKLETGNEKLETSNKKLETSNEKLETRKGWEWGKYVMRGKWWLVAAVVMVLIGVGGWGVGTYRLVSATMRVKTLIEDKKYDEADRLATSSLGKVRSRLGRVERWGVNRWKWGRYYQDSLRVGEQGLLLASESCKLVKRVERLNEGMFGEKEIEWMKELPLLKEEAEAVNSRMVLLAARMSGNWSWLPGRWKRPFEDTREKIKLMADKLDKIARAVDILPELLGADGKRREYLVLLQNESELRPNGGFIGSYGIVSWEGGRLLNFEINDIYEADGQLKGHVEPPKAIKNYLGEAKWYMRDANWQADFGMSAKDLEWFLEKETGRKVDGVIGLDLAVAKAALGVVGEVYVPDFKEKINKNNLYEQAEFYSETKFFPGSKQKASFLSGLGKQLFEEIKGVRGEKAVRLVEALVEMLDKNDLQIFFNKESTNAVVAGLGWDGAVYEGKCAAERCFADYLYLVEANLGVNKANYFLYRSVDQTVEIDSQKISRVLKIGYENTAKSNSWPGGDYKNYLRVYLPESSNLAEVSVAEAVANGVKTIYSGESLSVENRYGKKEVGFLVEVPAGKKKIVEVRYIDQINLEGKDKFSYLNYIQRQPGAGDTPIVSLVTVPSGWQVNQVEPSANLVGEKVLFNQKLEKDLRMGVEIYK